MIKHPEFEEPKDGPDFDEGMTDEDFFDYYGDPMDDLPFEELDTEEKALEQLYNRG